MVITFSYLYFRESMVFENYQKSLIFGKEKFWILQIFLGYLKQSGNTFWPEAKKADKCKQSAEFLDMILLG